jgi:hypothetical protein
MTQSEMQHDFPDACFFSGEDTPLPVIIDAGRGIGDHGYTGMGNHMYHIGFLSKGKGCIYQNKAGK